MVTVFVSVSCVVAVALGATVATSTLAPAVAFAQTGHWVVNSAESAAVHVDGGTRQVDARVDLPSDIGDPLFALQGERQGFVVAADRIAVFGRSTLTVDATIPVEFAEAPVGIETLGGPYLVYRQAGTIVRLGVPPLSLPVGGRLDRPVWTDDGTVWLHRPDNGSFCALRNGADALDCSAGAAPGEPGGLSITGELPAFVGTRQDAAQVIAARLGSPVGLGTDVVDAALLADRDTEGRLAVVEPATNRLVLTDSSGVPGGRDGGAPVVVDLGPGTFTSPVAADGIVALLDTAANRLLTYDVTGRLITTLDLPPGTDAADLVRGGDGRIYVDDADGSATHIVGTDGAVASVGTGAVSAESVAVAAPPSRRASVAPPPSRLPGPTARFGGGPAPVGGPPQTPSGSTPSVSSPISGSPNPNPVSAEPLAAPTGVAAALDNGSVTVTWRPIDGSGELVTYAVRASTGEVKSVGPASVAMPPPPIGVSVTYTVTASTQARSSVQSAPSNEIRVIEAPGIPTNLDLRFVGDQVEVSWDAPNLNGGELVHYVVDYWAGGSTTTRDTRVVLDWDNCFGAEAEITTVTRNPAGGSIEQGPKARAARPSGDGDCFPSPEVLQVVSRSTDADVRITGSVLTARAENIGAISCNLLVDGRERWSGTCFDASVDSVQVTIDGLEPDTEYVATLRASNSFGAQTSQPYPFATQAESILPSDPPIVPAN